MKIVFDPAKDAANRAKHGIGLESAFDLDWDRATIDIDDRRAYGEVRYLAYAPLDGRLHVACFTVRDGAMRIISFRKGNKREEKTYAQKTAH